MLQHHKLSPIIVRHLPISNRCYAFNMTSTSKSASYPLHAFLAVLEKKDRNTAKNLSREK